MTDEETPASIGRYQIVRRLGTGGMAEVFLAKSAGAEGIEKLLVLKRVLPTFARSAKFISMFVDEAKVAMRLNHPNIVQVYAFEQVKREFLLAMEFVDGLDLGRLVAACRRKKVRVPYGLAAFIVMEVAKGLDYAHKRKDERGDPMEIVHRDVSPQNVLLTYDGVVKVADFGIAKARMVSEETGVIKGKFSYMSPEQARGARVDPRSDVYSLGVLLAELLMGRAMYPGVHGIDVLERVRRSEVTYPKNVDPEVPVELNRIVQRATSEDREERYQSGRSLAGAINQYLRLEEEVWDMEALERFLAEHIPRSPEDAREAQKIATFVGGETVFSGVGQRELRERRQVVVVAGRVRADITNTGTESGVDIGTEAAKVLADIAYKADAVLSWPDGLGKNRFRFILGLGKASVNDPFRASTLALDLLEALDGLSADLLIPVTASVGLSRGAVSTVRDQGGRLLRYTPVGAVLEVAERLADAGRINDVLVAGEVFRMVRRDFQFARRDSDVDVRTDPGGAPRGIRSWRLIGARTREEKAEELRASARASEIVGRDDEMANLHAVFDEAVTTKRALFCSVIGELGVGKTAVVAAAIESIGSAAPRVLRTESTIATTDLPFGAVAELVRECCEIPDRASAEEAREKLKTALDTLITSDKRRAECSRGLTRLIAPRKEDGPIENANVITRGVEILVYELASRAPLIIWVDSLQWCDTPSLELVRALRQRPYDVPVLVIMGTRPDERVTSALAGVPEIALYELGDDDRRALLRKHFGDADVPEDVERAILSRAGGNPFFLIELVDALLERGVVTIGDGMGRRRVTKRPGASIQLPTTLEGVIASRLDELPEIQRRALRWLALAGGGLRTAELSTLAGTSLEAPLAELKSRGFISMRGESLGFASAVVRHVAYEATDVQDRVSMHRRVATLLSRSGAQAARIARHLEQAGDSAGAAQAYLDAADQALAMYSNTDAFRFFGRALLLLPPGDAQRFRAHVGREQILRFLGRPHEQQRELEAMRAITERRVDPGKRALALNRLARFELDAGRVEGVEESLQEARENARAAGDRQAEIDSLRLEAELARDVGEPDRALAACDRALERAGYQPHLLPSRGSVLVQRGILLRRLGRSADAFENYAEAIVIFRRLGNKRNEAFALNSLGVALTSTGEYEDAINAFRASVWLDRETGDRLRLGRKLSNIGQLYDTLGDRERAQEFVTRALDVFEAVDDRAGRCDALCAMAELMLAAGRGAEAALVPLDQARRISERLNGKYEMARERLVRAYLERERGDHVAAREAARAAVDMAKADGLRSYEVHGLVLLSRAFVDEGDKENALMVAEEARARGDETTVERAEQALFILAEVFESLDRRLDAELAYRDAATIVDGRLEMLRDPRLRERYLATREVKALRAMEHAPA